MRAPPAALQTHYALPRTTLATALKVTRQPGTAYQQVFGWTTHDKDATVSGVEYTASPGLEITNLVVASGAAVGNLELTVLHDNNIFTTADLLNGIWRNAAFEIFRYNYESVSDGRDVLMVGTFGEFEPRTNTLVIELRDLRQYLQQSVGSASSKTCRYRLGDSRCGVDLVGSPNSFVVSGVVTSVTSNQVFRDNVRAEAADFFAEGIVEWIQGDNASIECKVQAYAADGTFTLDRQVFNAIQVGDVFIATAGCRKRLEEDCRDKFNNVLNFGGEPHRKGIDNITAAPELDR